MVSPIKISKKNFSMFSTDIMQMPSRKRYPLRLTTSMPQIFAPSNDNENDFFSSSYRRSFADFPRGGGGGGDDNVIATDTRKPKQDRINFLKHISQNFIPRTAIDMFRTTHRESYQSQPVHRPTKPPDMTQLWPKGMIDLTSESGSQYTSPWQKMFGSGLGQDSSKNSVHSTTIRVNVVDDDKNEWRLTKARGLYHDTTITAHK